MHACDAKRAYLVRVAIATAVIACGAVGPVVAQSELGKMTDEDGAADDQFGYALAFDANYLLIGAIQGDKSAFSDTGAAYIVKREGAQWKQTAKLTASDGESDDRFGGAVAMRRGIAVIGASRDSDTLRHCGSVYVFEREGDKWIERQKLRASDAASGAMFGFAVATNGEIIVIGAHRLSTTGPDAGAVCVFEREGGKWRQSAKLISPGDDDTAFGRAVAIGDGYIVVSASGDAQGGEGSGACYVFRREGGKWVQQAKLTASDAAAGDRFGRSIAADGASIIVGAFNDDDGGTDSGSAYVFTKDGDHWRQQAKLTAINAAAGDLFGISVALSGDYAVVGAIQQDEKAADAGAAYIFRREGDQWTQPFHVIGSDAGAQDWFGFSVAIEGDFAAVGAIRDDDRGFDSGSVHLYQVTPARH